jgi:hypothetical protein
MQAIQTRQQRLQKLQLRTQRLQEQISISHNNVITNNEAIKMYWSPRQQNSATRPEGINSPRDKQCISPASPSPRPPRDKARRPLRATRKPSAHNDQHRPHIAPQSNDDTRWQTRTITSSKNTATTQYTNAINSSSEKHSEPYKMSRLIPGFQRRPPNQKAQQPRRQRPAITSPGNLRPKSASAKDPILR